MTRVPRDASRFVPPHAHRRRGCPRVLWRLRLATTRALQLQHHVARRYAREVMRWKLGFEKDATERERHVSLSSRFSADGGEGLGDGGHGWGMERRGGIKEGGRRARAR